MEKEEFKEYYTRLNVIFLSYNEDWLEDGQYHEEVFFRSPNFKMMEISFNELEDQITIINKKFGHRKELACNKLQALLNLLREQIEAWKFFPESRKNNLREYYQTTGFPFIYLCEKFKSTKKEIEKMESQEKRRIKTQIKAQEREDARKEAEYYFNRFDSLIKNSRHILLKKLPNSFAKKLLEHESFKDALLKIDRIYKIIDQIPSKKSLSKINYVAHNYKTLIENLEELKTNLKVFSDNLDIFQKNGKTIIKSQLSLSEDFFKSHSLFFIKKEIKDLDSLIDILYEYITFHGLIWVESLLSLKPITSSKDFNQEFFKKIGIYVASVDPVKKLPSGPPSEAIKTIKQGRTLSMAQTLKKEKILGVKNKELSKYELIQRIEDNLKVIRLTCRNLIRSDKTHAKIKKLAEVILDRNSLIIIERLPDYEIHYLNKIADTIYSDLSSCKNLGLKYLR